MTLAPKEPIPVLKIHPDYSWSSEYFTKWTGKHFLLKHSQRGQNCCKCLFYFHTVSCWLEHSLEKKHKTPRLKASSAWGGSSHLLSFCCLKNMLNWRVGTAEREGSRRLPFWKGTYLPLSSLACNLNNKNTDWTPWICFGVVFKMHKQVWRVGLCSRPCQDSQVTSHPPPGPRTPSLLTQPSAQLPP